MSPRNYLATYESLKIASAYDLRKFFNLALPKFSPRSNEINSFSYLSQKKAVEERY